MSIDSANAADKRKGGFKDSGIVIIEALLLALFINVFLFQPFVIPSGSMRPTLYVGDYVLTTKYAYGYSRYSVPHYLPVSSILPSGRVWSAEPKRGDIVVFRNPGNPNLDFIKRVVGLPGDTVQMQQGALYINGKAVPRLLIGKTRNVDAIGCIPPDWSKGESFDPAPDSLSAARCPGQRLFDPAQDQPVSVYRETLPNGVSYNTFDIYPMSPWDNTRIYEVPAGQALPHGKSGNGRFMSAGGGCLILSGIFRMCAESVG